MRLDCMAEQLARIESMAAAGCLQAVTATVVRADTCRVGAAAALGAMCSMLEVCRCAAPSTQLTPVAHVPPTGDSLTPLNFHQFVAVQLHGIQNL